MYNSLKRSILRTVWPPGKPARIVRGPLNGMRYVVSKQSGWSSIFARWEPGALEIYAALIQPGDVVYDLGANTGMHSLMFSKLAGETGKVVAFEPLPDNLDEIDRNIRLNGLKNVQVEALAISDQNGEADFLLGSDDKQGSLVGIGCETGHSKRVQLKTLDTFVEEGGAPPNFVKIDVEGAEAMVLNGFRQHVSIARPIFSIDLHTPEQDVQVANFLHEIGWSVFRFDAENRNGISSIERVKNTRSGWPDPDGVYGNILAVPPNSQVADALIAKTGNRI